MADRQIVACPAGHQIATTLRGRSTTCSTCGRRVYVRADGTTRHKLSRTADDRAARGQRSRRADRPAGSAELYDQRRYIEAPVDLIDSTDYDASADRTRFFDVDDNLIGWTEGNKHDYWPGEW